MYLYELSNNMSALIKAVCYLMLIVQMGSMMTLIRTEKKWVLWTIPAFLLTMLLLFLMMYDSTNTISGKRIVFCVAAVLYTLFLLLCAWKICRTTISNTSIKESIDHLPSGIGFSEKNGLVLLANDCMEQLCYELTGCDFQNAKAFWEQLSDGKVIQENAQILQKGSVLTYKTADGRVWSFEKKQLNFDGKEIFQYTATDTTLLYQISEKIQKNNEELVSMNARLQQYGRNMEEYVKGKEILEVKKRVHDKMGHALLATRVWLLQKSSAYGKVAEDENAVQEILKQWECVIALMKKENETEEYDNTWRYIREAADFAGIKLSVEGSFPQNPDTMRLFVEAAAEALTNAVRHGNANTFYVRILHTEKEVHCRFTNNGKVPTKQITEGGGLGTLRMRIEKFGGRMRISTVSGFSLEIDLPEGENE